MAMRLINADALLDAMNSEARAISCDGIESADDMLDAMEVGMRECVYNAPTVNVRENTMIAKMNNSEIEDTLAKLDGWAKTSRSKGRTLEQAAALIRKLRNEICREERERDAAKADLHHNDACSVCIDAERREVSDETEVTAEVLHGEWCKHGLGTHQWFCSVCEGKESARRPYCPRCGARMERSGNGE